MFVCVVIVKPLHYVLYVIKLTYYLHHESCCTICFGPVSYSIICCNFRTEEGHLEHE